MVRKQGGFDAGLGDPALGGALDHGNRAALQLRERVLVAAGDRHGVRGARHVVADKARRGGRAGELCIGSVVPAAFPQRRFAGEIAQPQMDFVSRDQRGDHIAAAAAIPFADRERDGEVAARVGGVARKIIVVAVEIAQQAAIHERRERRRSFFAGADQRRLRGAAAIGRHAPHRLADIAVEGAERAAESIERARLCRGDHVLRQLLVPHRVHKRRQCLQHSGRGALVRAALHRATRTRSGWSRRRPE